MSVYLMCDKETEGAYLNESWTNEKHEIWMVEQHKGCVVDDREKNGYDDSDFYAVVYVPEEDTFKNIYYASTRYWTYPNAANVDASPELHQKYVEWKQERERIYYEERKQLRIEEIRKACGSFELTEQHIEKLNSMGDAWKACANLLKVKNFRSEFRKSLRKQLEDWLNGISNYASPFSPKQWECLATVSYNWR